LRRGRKIKRDGVLRESYFGYSPIDADVSTFTLRYKCFGVDCRRRAIREIFVFACHEFRTPFSKEQNEKVQPYFAVACVNDFVELGTKQETEDAR
jgi:hypothetical protein